MRRYFALKIGLLTAVLFEALAWSFVLGTCWRSPIDCHEYGFFMYFVELPSSYLASLLLFAFHDQWAPSQITVNILSAVLFAVIGFIQYFIVGYAIGWGILFFKNLRRKTAS